MKLSKKGFCIVITALVFTSLMTFQVKSTPIKNSESINFNMDNVGTEKLMLLATPPQILITEVEEEIEEEIQETNYSSDDLYWLSRIISAEAKGESLKGKIAVGNVVLNRVDSESFPGTIKGVLFQKGQFCPVQSGRIYNDPVDEAIEAAKLVLEGEKVVPDNTYYFYNPKVVSRGSWIRKRPTVKEIGNHRFAK